MGLAAELVGALCFQNAEVTERLMKVCMASQFSRVESRRRVPVRGDARLRWETVNSSSSVLVGSRFW